MQIPCVYLPGPAPAVSVANSDGCGHLLGAHRALVAVAGVFIGYQTHLGGGGGILTGVIFGNNFILKVKRGKIG